MSWKKEGNLGVYIDDIHGNEEKCQFSYLSFTNLEKGNITEICLIYSIEFGYKNNALHANVTCVNKEIAGQFVEKNNCFEGVNLHIINSSLSLYNLPYVKISISDTKDRKAIQNFIDCLKTLNEIEKTAPIDELENAIKAEFKVDASRSEPSQQKYFEKI